MSLHDPHPLLVLVFFFLLHLVFGLSRVPQESPQSLRETGDWRAQGELDRDKKPSRRIKKWPIRSGTAALPRVCERGPSPQNKILANWMPRACETSIPPGQVSHSRRLVFDVLSKFADGRSLFADGRSFRKIAALVVTLFPRDLKQR